MSTERQAQHARPLITTRRFVVLRHEFDGDESRGSHFDLLIENGEVLAAWRMNVMPSPDDPRVELSRIADHRSIYLDYEGPISGNRGAVRRIDTGAVRVDAWDESEIRGEFDGSVLRGRFYLTLDSCDRWILEISANRDSESFSSS